MQLKHTIDMTPEYVELVNARRSMERACARHMDTPRCASNWRDILRERDDASNRYQDACLAFYPRFTTTKTKG